MKSHYLALLLIIPSLFYARISESEEQCVSRYGPADQSYEQRDTKFFHKAGFLISIHYFEGKADYVVYSKVKKDVLGRTQEISETELDGLLKINSGEKVWVTEISNPFRKDWTTEDGTLIAHYDGLRSTRSLIVLTKDCVVRKKAEKDTAEKEKLKEL